MKPKNPYSDIVKIMQEQGAKYNPYSIQLGTVVTISPLSIIVGELPLNKDNLLVADSLVSEYSREINLPNTNASGTTSNGSISSIGIPNGTLNFTDSLNVGDTLAVVQVNNQTFIILARVVNA